jgi:hypothetical protein
MRSAVKFKEAHPRRKTEIIDPDAPSDLALESGDSDKKDSISLLGKLLYRFSCLLSSCLVLSLLFSSLLLFPKTPQTSISVLDFFLRKGGHPGATIPSNFRRRQLNEDEEDDTSDLVNLMKRRTVMGESIIHALHSQLNAEELELLAASNFISPSLSPQESSIISSAVHSTSSSVIISPRDKEDELSPRKKRDKEKKEEKEREREKEKTRTPSSPPSSSSTFFVPGHTRQPSSSSAATASSSSSPFIPGHSRQPSTGAKGAPPIDLTQIMHSREVLGSLRSAHLSREEEDEVLEVLKTQTNNPEEVVKKLEKTRGGIGLFKAILSTISSSAISSSSSSAFSSSSSSSASAAQPPSSSSSSTSKPNRKETREEPATDLLNLMREPAITGQTRPAGVRTDETAPSDLDDEDYASRRLSRNITRRSRVLSL